MARVRYGVVLLIPPPLDREIEGLRRGVGDPKQARVAPHITIVAPVNVRMDQVPEALRLLRGAAEAQADIGTIELRVGPARSFRPVTETLYMRVEDAASGAVDALVGLREMAITGPLARSTTLPFVPHVTIADGIEAARIDAAVELLSEFVVEVSIDRLHLLQEVRGTDGRRRWQPVADMAFAPPAVVGRGGVELELTTSHLADPEVQERLGLTPWSTPFGTPLGTSAVDRSDDASAADPGAGPGDDLPVGATPVVITARRRGEVAGVIRGWHRPDGTGGVDRVTTELVVADDSRRLGIERQLELAFSVA